ncbi:MAG: 50S ribosomal protein L10 [Saccharofermentanales bacterium]|jgi:large subunit ribosomal protein L10
MPSEKILRAKQEIVAGLADEFKQAQSIVFADYRGLTVEQDTVMRTALRQAGVKYRVVKNSISSRALADAGYEGLDDILKGPTAIAYSVDDVVASAKVLKEYADKFNKLKIKGGIMEGKAIDVNEVNRLAAIPGKEVLQGQLVYTLVSPITCLAIVLQGIKEKMEGAGSESADA